MTFTVKLVENTQASGSQALLEYRAPSPHPGPFPPALTASGPTATVTREAV